MVDLIPDILRDLVTLFGFQHIEDPGAYSHTFEGRTLFWRMRNSILWCGHSLQSHAWGVYIDIGINFDDPTRLSLVFEFVRSRSHEEVLHLASDQADWAALKDELIRPWIEQAESDDDASGQDTDTSM